jgi:rhomboid protease GluP
MNDPQPKRHPLEEQPTPPQKIGQPRQRINLRIPAVSPTVTYGLIVINFILFTIRALSPSWDDTLFFWGADNARLVLVQREYYRLFTSMFLHAGIYTGSGRFALEYSLHILSNMYILYAVGISLERVFGHTRFLIIYLLGGLAGSILSVLVGSAESYSVGASGAVFAILGGEFVYLWHQRRLLGEAGRQRRRSLIAFAIMNLAIGLISTFQGSRLRIDNWAHLGGLIGGVALAWFISPIYNLRAHPDHPGELKAEDINPLHRRYWIVSVYATLLVILVFIGVSLRS